MQSRDIVHALNTPYTTRTGVRSSSPRSGLGSCVIVCRFTLLRKSATSAPPRARASRHVFRDAIVVLGQ